MNNSIVTDYFKEETTGIALAKTLDYVFNDFGSDRTANECAEYLATRTHHTIQQSIVRGIFIFLRKLASIEYYDDRNEASVKAAKVAIKAIDDAHIGFPMI